MDIHKNARSCPASRVLILKRHAAGESIAAIAEAIGMSERRAWEWLARARQSPHEPLVDRSSRPKRIKTISEAERDAIIEARRKRWTCRRIAREVGRSVSTVARVLSRAGLSRLKNLDGPPPPPVRYEWREPGALLHIDIKKLGRITVAGGINRHDRPGRGRGGGYEFVHVCVDDYTRLAYAEILPDEKATSAVTFAQRAIAWFACHGVTTQRILTDNGMCYRSHAFRALCERAAITHKRTRPYRPQTNGKVERMNQTLLREWSHAFVYGSSANRERALQPYLHFYNYHRGHTALSDQPPISRLLNNVLTRDTEACRSTCSTQWSGELQPAEIALRKLHAILRRLRASG